MKYELDESSVTLDTFNSDLNLVINASKYSAHPLTQEGFAFMWAGCRSTHGATKGRICYEVKVIEHLDVAHLPSDEPNPHVLRIGFSVNDATLQLGEDPLSYGYGGTGKISTNCQFKDYGPPFMAGDCILAVADIESDLVQIGFAKNGNFIGWAYKVRKCELGGKALFPHVLTKNCSFEVNFGQRTEPYFKLPDLVKNCMFVGCLPVDQRIGGSRPPQKREECEMLMMCGIPGAGKSVWAADYSKKNPEKKYNILGTNNIIDKMKVMGLPRKRNYHGRWEVLIQMATKCLNTMFTIGSKLHRNYILDQTNVYPSAQRRKMRNFEGFKRIAVVVVPSEEEYRRRCEKRDREEGKEVPDSAVLEMKANFKLPEESDIFEEVIFTELPRKDAEMLVKQYNEEGKAFKGPSRKMFRPNEPFKDNTRENFNLNKGDTKDNYRSFESGPAMRGRGTYGRGRGDYQNFKNHASYESNYNTRGGYQGPGQFDRNVERNYAGGYEDNQREQMFQGNRGGYGSDQRARGGFNSRGRGRGSWSNFDDPNSNRGAYGTSNKSSYGTGDTSYNENSQRSNSNFDDYNSSRGAYGTSNRGQYSSRGTGYSQSTERSGSNFDDYNSRRGTYGTSNRGHYSARGTGYSENMQRGSSNFEDYASTGGAYGTSNRGDYSTGDTSYSGNTEKSDSNFDDYKSRRGAYGTSGRGQYSSGGTSYNDSTQRSDSTFDDYKSRRGAYGASNRGNYSSGGTSYNESTQRSNSNFDDYKSRRGAYGATNRGHYSTGDTSYSTKGSNYKESEYTPHSGSYGYDDYKSPNPNLGSEYERGSHGSGIDSTNRSYSGAQGMYSTSSNYDSGYGGASSGFNPPTGSAVQGKRSKTRWSSDPPSVATPSESSYSSVPTYGYEQAAQQWSPVPPNPGQWAQSSNQYYSQ